MASIVDRMIRAAKLDPTLYDEVENDEGSMKQSMAVVAISSVAAGIGSAGILGPLGLIGGALAALVGWFIWALLCHFIGTTMLAEPATRATLTQVMRVTGFSAAPGVIRVFSFIPVLGTLINLVASLWMLGAFIIAVRQVLNFSSTGRSVAVCILGWLVQVIIFSLFAMIGIGGIALMFGSLTIRLRRKSMFRHTVAGFSCLVMLFVVAGSVWAADPVYREKNEYPVLDEMTAERDSLQALRESIRAEVDALYTEQAEARSKTAQNLRVDWSLIETPTAPGQFDQLWHTPPVPQYYTGTCWAFCSTSYMESEAKRINDVDVKLSEMWIVYWEYVEKARSFLREFGHTPVEQGGQDHGTLEILRQYGAVPREAYAGVLNSEGRHDHTLLIKELKGYLNWVLESGSWDEDQNMAYVRSILDKHMGPVPQEFNWEGATYTPQTFLSDVLELDMIQFRSVVSRMDEPFNSEVLLDVPDNWRRKENYLNLPLDDFYAVIKSAVQDGYTVSIGGDNSEAGMDGRFDVAIVPEWDIPSEYINQGSREFRIANGTTGDDHGVHVVGYKKIGDRDWFLIKDSNRSSRLGEHQGYYFWEGDYIKLKMLSFTIHEDRLKEYLN